MAAGVAVTGVTVGTAVADTLTGTAAGEVIAGGAGADLIVALRVHFVALRGPVGDSTPDTRLPRDVQTATAFTVVR